MAKSKGGREVRKPKQPKKVESTEPAAKLPLAGGSSRRPK